MVETAKRILTKEKIDMQLAGQTSSTPFMFVKDRHSKRVMFNAVDDLEQKIDRLTVMIGKLVTEDEGQSKPFKPEIYQPNRGRNQNRGNFCGRFRNIEIIITITEEMVIEVKIMTGTEVGH